jgi:lysophospholipase L1-like esterase
MARHRLLRLRWWMHNNRGELVGLGMAVLALILAVIFAMGCQATQTNSHANIAPIKDVAVPKIEFVGDDISQGLIAYAANPLWLCDDCQQGQTSTQALAGFSAAIGTKPDVILFVIGTYDLVPVSGQPAWVVACGAQDITCNNLQSMITQGQAAGCQIVIGTIPPWGVGPLATSLDPNSIVPDLLPKWNQHLMDSYGTSALVPSTIPVIDFDTALAQQLPSTDPPMTVNGPYIASYTNNGVDPNSAGYQIMVQLIQKQLGTMKFTVK